MNVTDTRLHRPHLFAASRGKLQNNYILGECQQTVEVTSALI